jgi:dihydrofolate synthase/folylpolyglutamate synthase
MDRSTAILNRMLSLHPKEIDLSLDRILRLLSAMDRPDRRLAPVIHVAGTNGKGSVTAFMRAMLEAAGYAVNVYTSPHLVRFHERIRLAGKGGSSFVDDDALVEALLRVERINDSQPITHFEITTAAALQIFADTPADITLLEVGLGGRLDATNVVADPLAAVITPIAIDHERFLGNTVAEIAGEKAGIIKRGKPAVIGPQSGDALAVIERTAARQQAPLWIAGQDWQAYPERGRLVFQDLDGLLDLPPPRLIGRHQFSNAGTAIAALHAGGIRLPIEAIENGLQSADWPARMQRLSAGRLVDRLPDTIAELWLDGGHNAGSSAAIAEVLADLEERAPRPLHLVIGMVSTKHPTAFLAPFAGLVGSLVAVPIPGHADIAPAELVAAAVAHGVNATTADSVEAALDVIAAKATGGTPARILICGSLYLAGQVLAANGTPPL